MYTYPTHKRWSLETIPKGPGDAPKKMVGETLLSSWYTYRKCLQIVSL